MKRLAPARGAIALACLLLAPSFAQAQFFTGSGASGVAPPSSNDAQFYPLFPGITVASGAAPLQNTARCVPFFPPGNVAQHIDQLAMTVSTLGTGPITVALYTDAIDATTHHHQPQTLISSGSFVVTSAATVTAALGTNAVGVAVPAGLNWACVNDTTASDAVRYTAYTAASVNVGGLIGSATAANVTSVAANVTSITTAATSGTWPSFAATTFADSLGATMPQLAARVASVP